MKSYRKIDGRPLVWMYLDEFYSTSQDEINLKIRRSLEIEKTEQSKSLHSKRISGGNNSHARSVFCITTNKPFNTAKEGSLYYNIGVNGSSVTSCCKGRLKSAGKDPETGEKLTWMYYEDYIKSKDIHKEVC
ncbi:hypothetical protein [Metabacillus endolithicus]|uniref:Uncharacterized protein n=1 Tax=Metabacillus endolithicus TaxID=1535204 RepID=A0ABW5C2E2_9BACI|nr:hypothetical protein [Metabacillus endolithicus]UPG66157.1 hypothetical protein MVE64_25960 [Metabacillus endolithicus]